MILAQDRMNSIMSPNDLITQEAVVASVKAEYGPNAELVSFNIQDFVKINDKLSSYVTGVQATIMVNGEEAVHSYIAKVNPCRESECWKCVTNSVFTREGYFLHDISPRLCMILRSYNQHPLRLPADLYTSCDVGKEILISKDFREDHFQLVDRKKGLDVDHAKLVLHEMARLHAASYLLEEQNIGEELQDMYPFLQEEWGDEHHVYYDTFEKYSQKQIKYATELLQEVGDYNKAISWLEAASTKIQTILKHGLQNTESRFKVICHGDAQINNILFRYDNNGSPDDVMLLDLQRARVSSVASDLNYFLYSSLDGTTRKEHLNTLLQEYYASFSTVMEAAHIPMRFTFAELKEEFHKKNILGLIYGLNAGITLLLNHEGLSSVESKFTSEEDPAKLKYNVQNPLFGARIKSLIDEMIEYGLIK